ncbi:rod shape-determining protein MreC [Patescibacteria group bacterium]|nr:rod shape-determining protein MreC [Patescibacteria group bacterium]
MNYPLKSKPKNENRGKVIAIITITLILFLGLFLMPNYLRVVATGVSLPIWSVTDQVVNPFFKIKNFLSFKGTLIKENLKLQDETVTLKLRQMDYDVLSKENQEIKTVLGRKNSIHRVAGILSKPPRSPFDTFVIDAGSSEGVFIGNKVYISENIIIGTITNVTPHTSLVQLFSTGGLKQDAVVSRTGTMLTITGRGGANFEIEVPKDTDILWGDSFLYPGLNSSILGNVYYIDTNSQSSFKTIYIRIPGNVFDSKVVYIE